MSGTRNRWLVLVALALAILAAACSGGGSKSSATTSTTAQPTATATSRTATPSPFDAQVMFRPAPDAFLHLSYGPGQAIDAKRGVFFMNTSTGAVDGWQVSAAAIIADGEDPAPCCAPRISDDNRFIAMRDSKTGWLLDRLTGKAVSWDDTQATLVALTPHHLLWERAGNPPAGDPNPEFDGRYAIYDENLALVSTFKLDGAGRGTPPVLFSPDEKMLVIPAGNKTWSDYTTLELVDVGSGATRSLGNLPGPPSGYQLGRAALSLLNSGTEFGVALTYSVPFESQQRTPSSLWNQTLALRYGWDGSPHAQFEVPAAGASFSPNGKWVAYEEIERWRRGEADSFSEYWSNVVIADGMTGAPIMRVRSASLYYGDGLGEPRWLSDSSGIPIAVRGRSPKPADLGYWRYRAFSLLMPSTGQLVPLALPEDDALAPTAAPDRAGVFATGHASIVDVPQGKRLAANSAETWFVHVPPWGTTSSELRFALPHGGHGGGYRGGLLPPRVEYPPFNDSLTFHVTGTGSCLNLRSAPAVSAAATTCLPDGAELTLSDPTPTSPYGALAAWLADDVIWIHVRTAAGDEGWVASSYLSW